MTCIHVKTPWSVFLDRSEGPLTYSAESSHVPVKQRARTPRAVTMKNYILCKALSEKLYFVCHEIQGYKSVIYYFSKQQKLAHQNNTKL